MIGLNAETRHSYPCSPSERRAKTTDPGHARGRENAAAAPTPGHTAQKFGFRLESDPRETLPTFRKRKIFILEKVHATPPCITLYKFGLNYICLDNVVTKGSQPKRNMSFFHTSFFHRRLSQTVWSPPSPPLLDFFRHFFTIFCL